MSSNAYFYSDIDLYGISSSTFKDCVNLNSIQILSAQSIDDDTFSGCSSLMTLVLPGLKTLNNVFGDKRSSVGINNNMTLSICNGTKNIGTNLSGLQNVINLDLP